MVNVFLRDAARNRTLNGPAPFLRVPVKGELVTTTAGLMVVIRVIHDWDRENRPMALCDLAPMQVAAADHKNGTRPEFG